MKNILNDWMKQYYTGQIEKRDRYERWISNIEHQRISRDILDYQPKISILIPVYNVLDAHLTACIDSVQNQTYDNWELCLADDCSTWRTVRKTLKKYENHDKIKVIYRSENGHISRCTNSALEAATGEFVAFLDCDDVLAPNALYEVARLLNQNRTLDFIYSDEDKLTEDGRRRHTPFFKPDWSPDTFMSLMYTSHLGVYRTRIAKEIGGLRPEMNGAQDYDFTLRFMECSDDSRVGHIDQVLYHWRERKESAASNPEAKPYALAAAKRAKEEALTRRKRKGHVEYVEDVYQYRVVYDVPNDVFVSIIIPSKDNTKLLFQCMTSIARYTDQDQYEIVIVDNGSSEENRNKIERHIAGKPIRYCYEPMEFNFSRMCNRGAAWAKGDFLLFLNDDIEITDSGWLARLTGHAALPYVGAVGAKLLYPDSDLIQHTGIINLEVGPSHALVGFSDSASYYFCRNRLEYDYAAVTGACLMIGREKFEKVGGFEECLPVAYNDVELGYRLCEAGFYNVVRNDVVLYHHESASRGLDFESKEKMERLNQARMTLYRMHPNFEGGQDPFYNRNLAPDKIDFSWRNMTEIPISRPLMEEWTQTVKEAHDIAITIDDVWGEEFICLKGWYYWKNPILSNLAKIYLALKNEQQILCFDVERLLRQDVAEAMGNGAYHVGFTCRIPEEDLMLKEGNYRIGLVVEMPVTHTRRINWSLTMLKESDRGKE